MPRTGFYATEWNRHVSRRRRPPGPSDAWRGLPGAAHLDSKEDTGFSAELLRSQGFRPASVGSGHGRSLRAGGGAQSLAPRPSPLAGGLHGVCMALLSPRGCPTQDASSRSLDLLDLDLCPGCKSSHHGWVVPWNGSQLVRGPLDYDFGDLQLQRWRGRAQEAPRRDALRAVRSTSAFGGQAPKTPQAPPSRLLCASRTAAGSFPS